MLIADQMVLAIHAELESNSVAFRKYPAKVASMIENLEKIIALIKGASLE